MYFITDPSAAQAAQTSATSATTARETRTAPCCRVCKNLMKGHKNVTDCPRNNK